MYKVLKTDKILVTGGRGFLGQAVCERLAAHEYVNVRTFSSNECSLTDQDDTRTFFCRERPDVVIHLAAVVGGIGANQKNPGRFAYENLMMGLNVTEMCRWISVKKLITAATICAYPKHAPPPFKETDIWNGFMQPRPIGEGYSGWSAMAGMPDCFPKLPDNPFSNYPEETNAPYGLAKRMLLVLNQAYRQQYQCNNITLFPVNLYGPGDHYDLENSHVIPAMLRKFHTAKISNSPTVTLWGNGSPTREFLYVEDCAEAFVRAMEDYDLPEPLNVGTGIEISMRDLAAKIAETVGFKGEITWDTSKPNGQPRRCLDITRIREALNWHPIMTFSDGLVATYEDFLEREGKNGL